MQRLRSDHLGLASNDRLVFILPPDLCSLWTHRIATAAVAFHNPASRGTQCLPLQTYAELSRAQGTKPCPAGWKIWWHLHHQALCVSSGSSSRSSSISVSQGSYTALAIYLQCSQGMCSQACGLLEVGRAKLAAHLSRDIHAFVVCLSWWQTCNKSHHVDTAWLSA